VVVVDATGDLPSLINAGGGETSTTSRVERFDASGAHEATIGPVDGGAYLVATDPDDDVVYVAGNAQSYWNGGPLTIAAFDVDGAARSVSSVPSEGDVQTLYGVLGGLAGRPSGAKGAYAVSARNPFDANYGAVKGFVFDDLPAPATSVGAPTDLTPTSATLHGTVDPNGVAATYHFEMSYNGGANWVALPDHDAGSGTSPVAVQDETSDPLYPGQPHLVRLVAAGAGGTTTSDPLTFTVPPDVPQATTMAVTSVGQTSATLSAKVNPEGAATTSWFEYGTDTSYGSTSRSTSAPDGFPSFGDVSQAIRGLATGTTYHYRVIARSDLGTSFGADMTFATRRPVGELPDGRVYEMVSPPDKNGYEVRSVYTKTRSSDDGNRVAYTSVGTFPDSGATASAQVPRYVASRTADRWVTRSVDPPVEANHMAGIGGMINDPQESGNFSPDLLTSAVYGLTHPLAPGALTDRIQLYRRSTFANDYQLVSKASGALPTVTGLAFLFNKPTVMALTPSLDHILFETNDNLVPEASGTDVKLYEWDSGTVRLVGVLPDGTIAMDAHAGNGSSFFSFTETSQTLSEDGSRIVFSTASDRQLYLRENGGRPSARTLWISKSEKATPDAPQAATFRDATPDGSRILFTTDAQLVGADQDAGTDLYAYDVDKPAGSHLTLVSRDSEPADGSAAGALGVLGMSRDGSRIAFAAASQLVAGAPQGQGRAKLYFSDHGDLRYVDMLSAGTSDPGNPFSPMEEVKNWVETQNQDFIRRISRITDDGRYVLYLNSSSNTPSWVLYDADKGTVACASCDPAGAPDPIPVDGATIQTFADKYIPRTLVERDGRAQVFFHTAASLAAEDTNGMRDVYRYDSGDGSVRLISSGHSSSDTYFVDASPDGRDVFFVTRESLSRWDVDENQDLYDARIGGGLPDPSVVKPCSGDLCQGASTPPPPAVAAASLTFAGPGNAPSSPDKAKPASVSVAKVKTVVGTTATLSVKVPAAGAIRLSGPLIGTARKTAARAATYKLPVRLSAAARRALKRKHTLRVGVRVVLAPRTGGSLSKTVVLTFKQAKPVKKGGR
jgi:hypothetical protein